LAGRGINSKSIVNNHKFSKMKKFFAIAIIAASLAACNNSGDNKTESKDSAAVAPADTNTMAPADTNKMAPADTNKMAPMDTAHKAKKDTSAKK